MRSPRGSMTVMVLLALLLGAPVGAQTAEDALLALDRTDDLIARATEIVSGADNALAQSELSFAVRLQANARAEFGAGHFVVSIDLTRRARLHADKAIAIVQGLPDPDRVLAQLERTRELLERARERIAECNIDRARALLRAAFEMQVRAEASADEGRYLAALQLTMSARERGHRALRMCNLEDNLREAADRALAHTDELISRARDTLADRESEPARQALSRAVDLQAEAWVQFRADHLEASLRLTQSARTFAHRAIRLAGAR